jgi:hypothetical protein
MFKNLLNALLPVIGKNQFEADIKNVKESLDKTSIGFVQAAKTYDRFTFKDKRVAAFDKRFLREVTGLRGNHIQVINQIFLKAAKSITVIERLNSKNSTDIVRSQASFSRLNLVQYVAAVNFALSYARKHINFVCAAETNLIRDSLLKGKELSKGEQEWLLKNEVSFHLVMNALNNSENDLKTALESVPDVVVTEDNADVIAASTGVKKLDPLGLCRTGFVYWPVYHLRMAWEDYKYAEYEKMKDELQLMEYRLEDLQNAQKTESNAKLEQAIEYYQERVDTLSYKLVKIEADAAK